MTSVLVAPSQQAPTPPARVEYMIPEANARITEYGEWMYRRRVQEANRRRSKVGHATEEAP